MASYLAGKMASSGGGESVEFLNQIVAQLWPNITTYASRMIKETADPMLKQSLPGPLSSMHFTKVSLGDVPIKFSNAVTTKTEKEGIKLDLNVDWDGNCDIELDGDMVPALGVEHLKMQGRLSVLLCPLIDTMPLIGAAQVALVNPPSLKLDFTGAANLADMDMIDSAVRETLVGVINSIVTLPTRYYVPIAADNDYFKTYIPPVGIIRITVEKAWGFSKESKSATQKFIAKLTRAAPDCYARVHVGAEEPYKTGTKNNTTTPAWGETHDFIVTDLDQYIKVDVDDEDIGGDDDVGDAITSVRDMIANGGHQELGLTYKGEDTGGKIALSCQYFDLENSTGSFSASDHKGQGRYCGLATVLVGGAYNIQGNREELKPSVVVKCGDKHRFQTAVKSATPGLDVHNPTFDQNFRVPMTEDLAGRVNFHIALMNGEKEMGGVDVPFEEVQNAEECTLSKRFDVGGGTEVRACISLKGMKAASMQQQSLPERPKEHSDSQQA